MNDTTVIFELIIWVVPFLYPIIWFLFGESWVRENIKGQKIKSVKKHNIILFIFINLFFACGYAFFLFLFISEVYFTL